MLLLQAPPALGPAGVLLALRAPMAGVRTHRLPGTHELALHPLALRMGGIALRRLPLELADAPPERGVLAEVAEVTAHRLFVARHRLLLLAQGSGEVDDRTVGLELGERQLEDLPGALAPELVDEVHGHVVRRLEARVQRVAAAGRERGDRFGVEPVDPLDDGVPLDVDAAATCTARELGVLPRRDRDARLAVELLELLEHDGCAPAC